MQVHPPQTTRAYGRPRAFLRGVSPAASRDRDSGYGDGLHFRRVGQAHGPLRLAILPIGAYEPRWFMRDQHMNPSDAVKALADCGAPQALAHHHGTFQLTDEAIDAPVAALDEALDDGKIPRQRFAALKPGQVVEI